MPDKLTLYSTLIGLLNLHHYNTGGEVSFTDFHLYSTVELLHILIGCKAIISVVLFLLISL